jgi:uncharacterized protein YjiS (DUF1127 family)
MSDLDLIINPSAPARSAREISGWDQLVAAVRLALRTWLTRGALPELSAQQLADIGVSRATALAEAARLPWDAASARQRRRAMSGRWAALRQRMEGGRLRHLIVGERPDAVSWGG